MRRTRPLPSPAAAEARPPDGRPRDAHPWLFRFLALTLVPALVLAAAEGTLRLAGYGYPAGFLVPVPRRGVYTPNQRFGWRFFPRPLARAPGVFEVGPKRPGTYRIFVLGGSAARGTPEPGFSFGRILQVMLEERHPGRRFEVHNAAMTAINSHVVLPIAASCAAHQPDLFLVYLGNNEVVGPYGAGTVFAGYSPSVTLVRAGLAVKATRLGQLLERGLTALVGSRGPTEWRGMEMFRQRRVAADDPRLATVYRAFRRNLHDIVRTAERAGARTVLSTVAVNLRDSPPFASLHRSDLAADQLQGWQQLYAAGIDAAAAGDAATAEARFAAALAIDDRYAELHFRRGLLQLAAGNRREARSSFERARDLDALRFRADGAIDRAVRQVADEEAAHGALLLDAAAALASDEPGGTGIPGDELFYEHVHLRYAGNYRLARAALERIEPLLGGGAAPPPVPSPERVARRLALTPFDERQMAESMLELLSRPPFTERMDAAERRSAVLTELVAKRRAATAEGWRRALASYRAALAAAPDDLELRARFATLLASRGETRRAVEVWRALVERIPGVVHWQTAFALALADSGRVEDAVVELRRVIRSWPHLASAHVNLGTVREKQGLWEEALAEYRRALELAPGNRLALFNLATAAVRTGRLDEGIATFRTLIAAHPDFAAAHSNLGAALERRDELAAAAEEYRAALALRPDDGDAHNGLGVVAERQGRAAEALAAFHRALYYEPAHPLAHLNLADLLLARGHAEEAVAHYRAGLAERPHNGQARYNLALALTASGRLHEAAAELRQLLAADPGATAALERLARILATAEDPALRDPEAALTLATTAAERTGHKVPEVLDTLALALAATGDAPAAATTERQAAALARAQGKAELAATLEARAAGAALAVGGASGGYNPPG